MRNITMQDGMLRPRVNDFRLGELFSNTEEAIEDDKSEYLHNTYKYLIKQAAVNKAADKELIAYVESFKRVHEGSGRCYFIDSGVSVIGPKSLSKS